VTIDIAETFEGASAGTNLSTSNTAFDVQAGTASQMKFDSTFAVSGTRSCKLIAAGASSAMRRTFTARNQAWCRVYVLIPTGSSTAGVIIANALNAGTNLGQIRVTSTRQIDLRNVAANVYTSTATMALDTWYRIEWGVGISGTTGQQVKLFLGHSTTPLEDSGLRTYTGASQIDRFSIGSIAADTFTAYFDDFTSNNTGFPGPSQVSISAADSASPADSAARSFTYARTAADAASPSDSAVRAIVITRAAADGASPADTATRTLTASRSAADSASPTDAATRALGTPRAAADSASPADAAGRSSLGYTRAAADSASAADTAARSFTGRARAAADGASPADTTTRSFTWARAAADSASPADTAFHTPVSASRSVSDSASPADTAARQFAGRARAASDAATPADTGVRAFGYARNGSDAGTPGDSATRATGYGRPAADAASPLDSIDRSITIGRSVFEVADVNDLADRALAYARTAFEDSTAADTVLAVHNTIRVLDLSIRAAAARFVLTNAGDRWSIEQAPDRFAIALESAP
jgi:hypothetical protein